MSSNNENGDKRVVPPRDLTNDNVVNESKVNYRGGYSSRESQNIRHGTQHKRNRALNRKKDSHGSISSKGHDLSVNNLDKDIQEELASGNFKMRGRKTQVSINHLLDFQLPEIERSTIKSAQISRKKFNRSLFPVSDRVYLHGDSFINANYRIIVADDDDYTEQAFDPNTPIDRSNIVRVLMHNGQQCPICLSEEPVAPRMVACGHVFCFTCLLHFFSIELETAKKNENRQSKKPQYKECPLCGSFIRSQNIKPVLFESQLDTNEQDIKMPSIGRNSKMQLMCKPHGSVLALPVNLGLDPNIIGNFPSVKMRQVTPYARIMKASVGFMLEQYHNDSVAIKTQNEIDRILYPDSGAYVHKALDEIDTKVNELLNKFEVSQTDEVEEGLTALALTSDIKAKYNDSNAHFFYQMLPKSSTKYFLSPLDVKILLRAFKQYSKFPNELEFLVENIQHGSMVTEDMIKRYKYFAHLPIGTELAFVEVDWRRNELLPRAVFDEFSSELKNRRRRLQSRLQREDQLKKLYDIEQERAQKEFLRSESGNGFWIDPETQLRHHKSKALLESLPPPESELRSDDERNSVGTKNQKYCEKTIWGTSITVIPDEETARENRQFEEMLRDKVLSRSQEGHQGSNKKKKKVKVMLFTNAHSTHGQ